MDSSDTQVKKVKGEEEKSISSVIKRVEGLFFRLPQLGSEHDFYTWALGRADGPLSRLPLLGVAKLFNMGGLLTCASTGSVWGMSR